MRAFLPFEQISLETCSHVGSVLLLIEFEFDVDVGYVSINLDHHGRTQGIILMEKNCKLHT